MEVASVEDSKSYFEVLQKFALIREYEKKGINTEKIRTHVKFNSLTPKQLYFNIKKIVDNVHVEITGDPETEVLNSDTVNMVNNLLDKPAMGEITPYPSWNELFRGLRVSTCMCVGMLSNAGKSRFMVKLFAYLAFVRKEKCLVMINEMSVEDIRLALLTTCINNPEFQQLHGIILQKDERELALGLYRHKTTGEYIYRNRDEEGNYTETLKEYQGRLSRESFDYSKVIAIANWIEEQSSNRIWVIDTSTGYSDADLETYIRKNLTTKGIKYFFYDTLKNELSTLGEWAALKATVTKLAELSKNLNIFLYGSIQLTDDAQNVPVLELNSMNIAASKGLKTVLSSLTLWREIEKKDYSKYYYVPTQNDESWGTSHECDIHESDDPSVKYYVCLIDKNRQGAKKKMLFKVNLDQNVWSECGFVYRK